MAPLLKDDLLTVAPASNSSTSTPASSDTENEDPQQQEIEEVVDVLIIGAGWAGLGAAKELLNNNQKLKIQILEGRPVIGGRCRTMTLQDGRSVADLGAQWIHGATAHQNPVYDAALASGIDMARSNYSSRVAYEGDSTSNKKNVRVVPQNKLEEMHDTLMSGKDGFFQYQERRQEEDEQDISLQQCAEEYLAQRKTNRENNNNTSSQQEDEEEQRWLDYILDSEISQEYAGSLEDMSMYWWDSDDDIMGGDVHLAQNATSGYKGLLDHFARDILSHESILQLNSKVTSIDYSNHYSNCVAVRYTQNHQEKFTMARRVVVTVPVGVLQAKIIHFEPALPRWKQLAIDRMGVGLYNKCIFLWDDADADKLPWPQDKEWMEKIVSAPSSSSSETTPQGLWTEFFNSQPVTGRPMLCAFTASRLAEEMEQYTEQEIQASAMKALQEMFPENPIPAPVQVVVTKWGQDEFARGAYSFNALGGKHSGRKQLAAPIDGMLYFAGEACHSEYFGTTHGALLSGLATAKQIVKDCSKETNKADTTTTASVRTSKSKGKLSSMVKRAFKSARNAVAAA